MQIAVEKLQELLVTPGHVSEEHFARVLEVAKRRNISPEESLVEEGYVTEDHLGRAIADGFDVHYIDLKTIVIPEDIIRVIPEVVARSQQAVIFERTSDVVKLATVNPDNVPFIADIVRKTGMRVEVYYTTHQGIKEALKFYRGDLGKRVERLLMELASPIENKDHEHGIVELVNAFLEYAYANHASDIHMEPLRDVVTVRFRVDGMLHEIVQYPISVHDALVSRLKIMGRLRTDEHAAAQDGRFDYTVDEVSFDVRMSVLPVMHGENIVLRLLARHTRRFVLEELGLSSTDLERVHRALKNPHGMLLSTGPTGSGKTTTLYAMLQILNEPAVNIMTIEDPVEYSIPHVQQTQVNPQKNLTFATGLRSIVRQDPNIIMVGEIRDEETASIAINAALTGHLVLSTLHTNDAATAFPRLTDMNIEPFLLASSMRVIIAQRLVRNICATCRASYVITKEEEQALLQDPLLLEEAKKAWQKPDVARMTLYRGVGCKTCGQSGFIGRTGIFEVLEMDSALRPLVTGKASSDVLSAKAREQGMHSMIYDGLLKVAAGATTLDEVLRVIRT
ncbi:MAG: GspE/PulE family protein [Patescibacteria group bacterium]